MRRSEQISPQEGTHKNIIRTDIIGCAWENESVIWVPAVDHEGGEAAVPEAVFTRSTILERFEPTFLSRETNHGHQKIDK